MSSTNKKNKPFLKWPGGKLRLANKIVKELRADTRLVEPFIGSGAIFLNTHFDHYLLADNNPDLIRLYLQLQQEGEAFIAFCKAFFTPQNNTAQAYYAFRKQFNQTQDMRLKSALFIYLNRHCYNGLCRYNAKNIFNTPFGRYDKPYFPQEEMQFFHQHAQKAEFVHASFTKTLDRAKIGDAIYCDPPYAPIGKTICFNQYFSGHFTWQDQIELANRAQTLSEKGIQVIISNHNTCATRKLYRETGARLNQFYVQRTISRNANNRLKVGEILANFLPAY